MTKERDKINSARIVGCIGILNVISDRAIESRCNRTRSIFPSVSTDSMSAIVSGAIPETLSPQVQTVLNFLTLLGAGDIDKLSNLLSDDLSYYVHPKSLNIPCLAKHEWLQRVKKGFVGMKFYIFEIVCERPSVAVHVRLPVPQLRGLEVPMPMNIPSGSTLNNSRRERTG
ncbi:unnamed protein product [Somion occarium]|uniref:Uncharacterized protein n=1 Tax=Somion occarium TaxID=3059160 RepID=A0ABP1DUS6_9APHY